eukprot:2537687-Prymnesium_polylepis.2
MASCDTQAAHQDDEVLHLFRDTLVVELGAEARRLFVLAAIAAKAAHPAALDGFEFLVEDHLVIPSSAVAERVCRGMKMCVVLGDVWRAPHMPHKSRGVWRRHVAGARGVSGKRVAAS